MELLPVINEEGEIIGSEDRDIVHAKGLLHLGARVIVKLPDGKIVFQRRALNKQTDPGKLAITAGGHIQFGQTPEEGAATELLEETGIVADPKDFILLSKHWMKHGTIAGVPHHVLGYYYGYQYDGNIEDFIVEENDGAGFEGYTFEELESLSEEERGEFCDTLLDPHMMEVFKKV